MDNLTMMQKAAIEYKLTHFLLFHGSGAAERFKAVLYLACTLNCQGMDRPCGLCPACRKIESGNHPDIHIVKPIKTSVGIDQIIQLQEKIYRKRYEGQYRICLVEEADKLTLPAANALLKIAEEPPENTILILSATNGEGIIDTLQSRAQSIYFSSPDKRQWNYGDEAYILSGGEPDLARRIIDHGLERIKAILTDYLKAVETTDYLKIYSLFPLEREEILILIQILAGVIREKVINDKVSPRLLEEVGGAEAALRRQANSRLALEVLALKHIELGGSKNWLK